MKKSGLICSIFVLISGLYQCKIERTPAAFSGLVRPVGLEKVRLLDGLFLDAQQRDLEYLKQLVPDKLLAGFRITSGLSSKAEGYKGWEEREVRGHFTGHYLSACAMMYAAAGDPEMKQRVNYISKELMECQLANGNGYISAFPIEFIDRVESCKPVWAPYYTIHKILAGLVDSYRYCADTTALDIAAGMADWIYGRCSKLSTDQMQAMLDHTEQGGMNEVCYDLYSITGNARYEELAKMFYQQSYFRPLSDFRDSLKGQHVNSFIPNVIGLARGYDLTGEQQYKGIAEFFWKTVTETRTFITGGTSNGEIWGSDNWHIHNELGPSSHESCCTYNMLKLTRQLWKWNQDASYSDYYERALWNGILPTQNPVTGMSMYYVPMESGYYKTFGTPENSFWCCTGTGVENFARTGECIYYIGNGHLFIDQYIASKLVLDSIGFAIKLETSYPETNRIKITIDSQRPRSFGLSIRIPGWISDAPIIRLNDRKIYFTTSPRSYLTIDRVWRAGDQLEIEFPMRLYEACLPDAPDTCAILYGPVVLTGRLGRVDIDTSIESGRYGPYDAKKVDVPVLNGSEGITGILSSGKDGLLNFTVRSSDGKDISLIPFYRLFGERYALYWPKTTR